MPAGTVTIYSIMSNFEHQEHTRQNAIRLSNSDHRGDALAVLRVALRQDPHWMEGYMLLAGYATDRCTDEDLAILRNGCKCIPDNLELRVLLANFLRREAPAVAIQLLHEYVQTYPKDRHGRYHSATFLAESGFPDEAVAEFEPCVIADPGNALIRGHFADFLVQANQLDRALAEYRVLTLLEPANAMNYDFLGSIARRTGNADMAIDAFTEAVRLDADLHFAWAALADLLEARGLPKAALAAHNEVIRITDDANFPEGRPYLKAAREAVARSSEVRLPAERNVE